MSNDRIRYSPSGEPSTKPVKPRPLAFLRGFLRNPAQVGSVIPSSRFLMRRIVALSELDHARHVIELGPGTGGTTCALLKALASDARLMAVDLDPAFSEIIRQFNDDRLISHTGSAEDITSAVQTHHMDGVDAVISGIPFSTIPETTGLAIVSAIHSILNPGGVFLAYQFRSDVVKRTDPVFGAPARVESELLNIPPMHVYQWRKSN